MTYSEVFEWRLAAQWAGYRYEDFVMLEGDLQSAHVAAYRDSQALRAVMDDAAVKQSAKNAKKKR